MIKRRKKRSLDRSLPHRRDTNIVFIGIEGGDDKAKKAIERARNKDNSNERWPNGNGSRVYKIIERFFEE